MAGGLLQLLIAAAVAAVHIPLLVAAPGSSAGTKAARQHARRRVTVWWKPAEDAATIRSDVEGMVRELACTDTIIYCGYATLQDGTFGVDPAPAGGWGNASLCAQAVETAADAGLGVQIIVEGRVGGHVKAALRLGGAAFGRQAAAVMRRRYPRASGLNVDWEVGRNKTAAKPLPTQLEMDTFTAAFARALSPSGLKLSVCASQFTSYVSDFAQIFAAGATIYDMGLYHGLSGPEWEGKLRNASSNAGPGALASGALAVGMSLEPKFPWENTTASLSERFAAIERSGATHLAAFAWGGRGRFAGFGLPPAVAKEWGAQLASFVKGGGTAGATPAAAKSDDDVGTSRDRPARAVAALLDIGIGEPVAPLLLPNRLFGSFFEDFLHASDGGVYAYTQSC
jgi:hypothetical protein